MVGLDISQSSTHVCDCQPTKGLCPVSGKKRGFYHAKPTPADDIEGIGIKLALYVYMSGVDPEKADSAVEQVLSAYKDCGQVLGRDLLVELKGLMPAWQQGV